MDRGLAYDDKISYDFFLDYIRHSMLETALIEKVLEGRVFEEEQVNARHILVEEEETAKALDNVIYYYKNWIDKPNAKAMLNRFFGIQ